jgi:hypothetical protein
MAHFQDLCQCAVTLVYLFSDCFSDIGSSAMIQTGHEAWMMMMMMMMILCFCSYMYFMPTRPLARNSEGQGIRVTFSLIKKKLMYGIS